MTTVIQITAFVVAFVVGGFFTLGLINAAEWLEARIKKRN